MKISKEEKQGIISLYNEGITIGQLSKKLNRSAGAIYYVLQQAGIEIRNKQSRISEEIKQEIIKKYIDEKLSTQQIGKLYNLNPARIFKILKGRKIQLRSRKEGINLHRPDMSDYKIPIESEQTICRGYKEGKSIRVLARETGHSSATICRCLRRNGIRILTISEGNKKQWANPTIREKKINSIKKALGGFEVRARKSRKRTGLTEEDEKEICQEYQQGVATKDIIEKFAISEHVVYNCLRRYNIPIRSISESLKLNNPMFNPEVRQKHYDMAQTEGWSKTSSDNMKDQWIKNYDKRKQLSIDTAEQRAGKLRKNVPFELESFVCKQYEIYGMGTIAEQIGTGVGAIRRCLIKNKIPIKNPGYYITGWHNSPKAGEVFYRSSYELSAFLLLDSMGKVLTYKVNPFQIPYNFNNEEHLYIPDILIFYNDNSKELVEIKPKHLIDLEENHAKFEAGELWCRDNGVVFSIWSEPQLIAK